MKKLYLFFVLALAEHCAATGGDCPGRPDHDHNHGTGQRWFAKPDATAASDVGSRQGTQYDMMQEYMKDHPNITFDVHGVPFADLDSTQLAAMEAHQGPDIIDRQLGDGRLVH